jgi:hypothetical protein
MIARLFLIAPLFFLLSGCGIESHYVFEEPLDKAEEKSGRTIASTIRFSNFRVDTEKRIVVWAQNNTHEAFVIEKGPDGASLGTTKYLGRTYNYASMRTVTDCVISNAENWECPGIRMIDGELAETWSNHSRNFKKRYKLGSF